jgi:hypothetical protein
VTLLPLAHGIGGVKDLPIPLWLFYYGGAVVLVVSFAALGALWRKPRLDENTDRPLPFSLGRSLRVIVGAISLGLFVLVFLAALAGERSIGSNLAPTFVWVVFWLGLVPVVVIFGNVWTWLSPWRAAADFVAWCWRRARLEWEPIAHYPRRLGCWPAAALLFAFAALELAYSEPSDPRALALAIAIYSWITWLGMTIFGRDAWTEGGEAFHVYFGFLALIAPFAVQERDGRRVVVVRPPLAGLTARQDTPGTVAFVAVMLGSVAFDGFSRTSWWQDQLYDLVSRYIVESPRTADLVATAFNLLGLLAAVGAVALLFLAAVYVARLVSGTRGALVPLFVGSRVPIALAYSVAHYFTLLVNQGQFAIPLLSDPFGKGWDVFGTDGFQPSLFNSPNAIWYTQVAVLVVGHVLGLALAHDKAVAIWGSARTAVRTQYAMLALMVLYTCTGLWLLSAN